MKKVRRSLLRPLSEAPVMTLFSALFSFTVCPEQQFSKYNGNSPIGDSGGGGGGGGGVERSFTNGKIAWHLQFVRSLSRH